MLYLVATPIGNLDDLSFRALRILKEVSLIAAEDTRKTQRLLARYDIHTPLTSYFEHNKLSKLDTLLAALETGDVALVSEAGMPGISDPGYELVRAAVERGVTVTPLPGPSAPIAALAAAGLPTDRFLYLGFLPRQAAERRGHVRDRNDRMGLAPLELHEPAVQEHERAPATRCLVAPRAHRVLRDDDEHHARQRQHDESERVRGKPAAKRL